MPEHNHQEQDFFPDDREIEISDLPQEDQPRKSRLVFFRPAIFQNTPATHIRKILSGARYTPRQRKRQAILTSSIALLAVIVFLVSIFPVQTLFTQLISSDSKHVLSGDDLFYFPELPSWGTFSLDGKPLRSAPMTDSGPPVQLPRGTHTLEWQGEPFSQLQCTLIVPPIPDQQTCNTHSSGSNEYVKDAWIIDFPINLSLQQLSESERTALTGTLQNLLNGLESSEIVQPGERYSSWLNGRVYFASQQLQATQRFLLDTDTSNPADCKGPRSGTGCSWGSSDCRLICSLNWPVKVNDPTMRGWHIAAVVRQSWDYAPAGKSTQRGGDTSGDQYLVTFQITRVQHQWRAAFHPQGASPFDDPNCIGLVGQITSSDAYQQLDETQQRITWTFSSARSRASGCLATASFHGGTSLQLPASSGTNVYLLYRFNQLQAATEPAHQIWPALPQADKHAQEVAVQIAKNPAFVS